MKKITVDIPEDQLSFFLELIQKLGIKISNENSSNDLLLVREKTSIDTGLDDIEKGRIISHQRMRSIVETKINQLRNQ